MSILSNVLPIIWRSNAQQSATACIYISLPTSRHLGQQTSSRMPGAQMTDIIKEIEKRTGFAMCMSKTAKPDSSFGRARRTPCGFFIFHFIVLRRPDIAERKYTFWINFTADFLGLSYRPSSTHNPIKMLGIDIIITN